MARKAKRAVGADTVQPSSEGIEAVAASGAAEAVVDTTGKDAQPIQTEPGELAGTLAGVQLEDGTVVELAELPEEDLRQLGADLEVPHAAELPVTQLVEAIQAEEVQLGPESPASPPDRATYIVNRERLEHDGVPYTFGEPVVIGDEKSAQVLLALGAILEDE